ncbi:hypothetical protein THRCLA_07170 [Thraustotheca clavata]|uniref:Jacalin-type lectin domain-containing protein n=1 Tax=Thraustotheca clavata TaxID=74557 RepID=A0A1V9ZFT6_9STRA|nr:hypothetical protein THRCLA_07170 [Thraustotheca clavata]
MEDNEARIEISEPLDGATLSSGLVLVEGRFHCSWELPDNVFAEIFVNENTSSWPVGHNGHFKALLLLNSIGKHEICINIAETYHIFSLDYAPSSKEYSVRFYYAGSNPVENTLKKIKFYALLLQNTFGKLSDEVDDTFTLEVDENGQPIVHILPESGDIEDALKEMPDYATSLTTTKRIVVVDGELHDECTERLASIVILNQNDINLWANGPEDIVKCTLDSSQYIGALSNGLHQLGHSFGLGHSIDGIMSTPSSLHPINRIFNLYSSKATSTVPPYTKVFPDGKIFVNYAGVEIIDGNNRPKWHRSSALKLRKSPFLTPQVPLTSQNTPKVIWPDCISGPVGLGGRIAFGQDSKDRTDIAGFLIESNTSHVISIELMSQSALNDLLFAGLSASGTQDMFLLLDGEYIIKLDVAVSNKGYSIAAIRFHTNLRISRFFGGRGGRIESLVPPAGCHFYSLFGACDDHAVGALGAYYTRMPFIPTKPADNISTMLPPPSTPVSMADQLLQQFGSLFGSNAPSSAPVSATAQASGSFAPIGLGASDGEQDAFATPKRAIGAIFLTCNDAIIGLKTLSSAEYKAKFAEGHYCTDDEHVFTLVDDEVLIQVDVRSSEWVHGIRFHTNRRISPWYGGSEGVENSFVCAPESCITGFFGSHGRNYLGTLGAYFGPLPAGGHCPTQSLNTMIQHLPTVRGDGEISGVVIDVANGRFEVRSTYQGDTPEELAPSQSLFTLLDGEIFVQVDICKNDESKIVGFCVHTQLRCSVWYGEYTQIYNRYPVAHHEEIQKLEITNDNLNIVSGSYEKQILQYNLNPSAHTFITKHIEIQSPNGHYLVTLLQRTENQDLVAQEVIYDKEQSSSSSIYFPMELIEKIVGSSLEKYCLEAVDQGGTTMGHAVSSLLEHDPNARRLPSNAVENESRFEFCEQWTTSDVNEFLITYTRLYNELEGTDLHKNHARQRELEVKISDIEAHLLIIHNEQAASTEEDNKEKDSVEATITLQKELAGLKQELYTLQQLPTFESIDLNLPLHGGAFLKSVRHIEMEAKFGAMLRKRSSWHISTLGYELNKDPTATAELQRYSIEMEKYVAPKANHEIDGHTDDNASDSENGSIQEEDDDDEDVDKVKEKKAKESPLTPVALEQLNALPPPLPPMFDPSLRSPVYFGYTTEKAVSPVDVSKESSAALEAQETKYFEARMVKANKRHEESNAIEKGKLKSLLDRRNTTLEKRTKLHASRDKEIEEAKKEGVDPTADFFRKMETSGAALKDEEEREDDLFASQHEAILGRMEKSSKENTQEIDLFRRMQSGASPPIAPLRRSYHEDQLTQLASALSQAREQAAKTLEETKARVANTATPNNDATTTRTQLLFANDQVIAAEKLIANIVAQIAQEEFMLKRADEMREIEALYLPVYKLLVSIEDKVKSMMQSTALLLVLAIRGSSLTQKLKYVFQLNIGTIGRIEKETLTRLLKLFFTLLDAMKEFKMPKLNDEAWCNLGDRDCASPMSWFDFKTFCIDGIERSQTLSNFFKVPWRFAHFSRITLQSMTPLHQYELGIISLSDLKFALAKQHLKSRTELAPHRRETLHIRALSMGANDPLKTDYSKYLKHRKTKVLSNAVPLDHGCYRNLLVYRAEVAKKAAIRLQTTWRAKKGRHDAYMAAKKQAFYHAKGTALMEARQSVEKEWQKLETTKETTIEKMKFDAKIRMRQVKLRTKGLTMDRRQVLLIMTEEAVQDALEEIDHRFREMEEDAGYVPVCLRFDPLNMDHFAEISTALIDQLKRARLPTLETANLLKRIAEKDKVEQPEVEVEKPVAAAPPVLKNTQVSPKHFVSNATLEAKKNAIEGRHLAMMQGKCPLYNELTSIEKRVWLALASSSPELDDWVERLQYICVGLTEFKLNEFLLELPSKRHAMEYTMIFRRPPNPINPDTIEFDREALITDLQAHFRIVRGVEELADSLVSMAQSDIENQLGFLTSKLLKQDEAFLESHVVKAQMRTASIAQKERKRKGNVGGKDMLQRLEFEQKHQLQLVQEAKLKANEAISKWKHAQLSLDLLETKLHTASMEMVPKLASLTDRTQWAERLKRAIEASGEAWIEVFHVSQDFVHTAQQVAVQIAREYFAPLHMKSILPLSTPEFKVEGRDDGAVRSSKGRGLRFEVHNIRFEVILDDHGRYDNCDEFAMKAAAAEIRNSSLYLPLLMATPSILVPLSCIVDYLGLRVLCVAKLPIERYDINDRGIIQNTYTEFVYGSNNHGKTMVYHSKSLDGAVRKANGYLNLTTHGVRGTQDLTAKMISGAGDMHGYVGRDEWLCLLRFRRSMPPEDPEETHHLPSSTRGLSILWRQLRPALVQSQLEPLSSDSLSFMTNNAPDWEIHANRVKAATINLLDEVIPAFARKMATRSDYMLASSFALIPELHRHGINVRHLGYLRHQFRYQLSGTAAMTFNSNIISTTEDMTRQVQRGDTIYIHGEAYQISLLIEDKVSSNTLTVDRPYKGDSTQGVAVYTGGVIDAFNCVRELLLVEMIQRCIKNLLRSALRSFLRSRQIAIGPNYTTLIVTYLNFISGAIDGAHSFWDVHVFEGIRFRFGPIAVSFVERLNLRRAPVAIVKYLCESIGFELTPSCWKSFQLHPDGFLFSIDDLLSPNNLEGSGTGCRVKHNLSILHFAAASLLLELASLTQGTTYQAGILVDQPCGYWPLNERRGATVAKNLGSSSDHGKFSKSCILETHGSISNDDLCRAIGFPNSSQAYTNLSIGLTNSLL